jgi:hypothetical protein
MKQSKIIVPLIAILAVVLLIAIPELTAPSLYDSTADQPSEPLNLSEIDGRIEKLGNSPWSVEEFRLIQFSIDVNVREGNISDLQKKALADRLNAAYISTLNKATKDFFSSGSYNIQEISSELSRFVNMDATRKQVDTAYHAIADYYMLLSQKDRIDDLVRKQYDESLARQIREAVKRYAGASPVLANSPQVRYQKEQLLNRIDKFSVVSFEFSNTAVDKSMCDSLYAEYDWYRDSCRRRQ